MFPDPHSRSTATCRKCSEYRFFATCSSFPAKCVLLLSHFWVHSSLAPDLQLSCLTRIDILKWNSRCTMTVLRASKCFEHADSPQMFGWLLDFLGGLDGYKFLIQQQIVEFLACRQNVRLRESDTILFTIPAKADTGSTTSSAISADGKELLRLCRTGRLYDIEKMDCRREPS
jgi:hypothetical protein